jgi:hypothetical protein
MLDILAILNFVDYLRSKVCQLTVLGYKDLICFSLSDLPLILHLIDQRLNLGPTSLAAARS